MTDADSCSGLRKPPRKSIDLDRSREVTFGGIGRKSFKTASGGDLRLPQPVSRGLRAPNAAHAGYAPSTPEPSTRANPVTAGLGYVRPRFPGSIPVSRGGSTSMSAKGQPTKLRGVRSSGTRSAARGTFDSDTLRPEGDGLMEELGAWLNSWRTKFEERVSSSLAHYFDPQQGTFMAQGRGRRENRGLRGPGKRSRIAVERSSP